MAAVPMSSMSSINTHNNLFVKAEEDSATVLIRQAESFLKKKLGWM